MHFFTSLTRMWLTRTVQPFTFRREYDQALPFAECESLGLYVHIPFCKSICNFCPYCKVRYSAKLCDRYIDSLIQEIHLVGGQYPGQKKATSLYFGGGTPALAADRIKEIIDALGEHFIITEGIGLELHPDNVTVETLQTLKEAGVTKISIGIQSFSDKYQKILGRKTVDTAAMAAALAAVPFETVSMDFIFALPGQTFEDLRADIDGFNVRMQEQKERARNAAAVETGDWVVLHDAEPQFVGYDLLTCDTEILRYRRIRQKNKDYYQLVLSITPFYAEMGGQAADQCQAFSPSGGAGRRPPSWGTRRLWYFVLVHDLTSLSGPVWGSRSHFALL